MSILTISIMRHQFGNVDIDNVKLDTLLRVQTPDLAIVLPCSCVWITVVFSMWTKRKII